MVMLLCESEGPKQLVNVKDMEGKCQCCGGQGVIPGAKIDPGPRIWNHTASSLLQ